MNCTRELDRRRYFPTSSTISNISKLLVCITKHMQQPVEKIVLFTTSEMLYYDPFILYIKISGHQTKGYFLSDCIFQNSTIIFQLQYVSPRGLFFAHKFLSCYFIRFGHLVSTSNKVIKTHLRKSDRIRCTPNALWGIKMTCNCY